MTPEEIAAAEAATAKQVEDAKIAADAKAKEEADKKALEDEAFDKDRAMKTIQAQREENKALKARAKRADELEAEAKKRADAELSETDRLKKENDEIKAENAKTQNDLIRRNAVEKAGLPSDFAKRLTGSTAEELEADALALAKTLPQLKVAPKLPLTNPGNAQVAETEAQQRQRIFGQQQANIFDVKHIMEHGGGVMDWTTKKEQP
jgi:colicin import membrane protein